jgi:hypothetical protein
LNITKDVAYQRRLVGPRFYLCMVSTIKLPAPRRIPQVSTVWKRDPKVGDAEHPCVIEKVRFEQS